MPTKPTGLALWSHPCRGISEVARGPVGPVEVDGRGRKDQQIKLPCERKAHRGKGLIFIDADKNKYNIQTLVPETWEPPLDGGLPISLAKIASVLGNWEPDWLPLHLFGITVRGAYYISQLCVLLHFSVLA